MPEWDLVQGIGDVFLTVRHRNKHIMIDLGTGNNNKMWVFPGLSQSTSSLTRDSNWAMRDKQEASLALQSQSITQELTISIGYRHH